jgi:hypothetical protein
METHNRLIALDHRPPTGRNLLLVGFWMRLAITGALVAAAGFAYLLDPPRGVQYLLALTSIVTGGTVAWFAWQRTVARCGRIDEDVPIPSDRKKHVSPERPVERAHA